MGKLATSLAAITLAGALAACDSDAATAPPPTPSDATTTSVTPTPSASTTPTPPVMPEAAEKHTKAGAIAFARYVVELVNYSLASLDTRPLESVASDYCKGCHGGTDGIKRIATRDGVVTGGRWSLAGAQAAPLDAPGHPIAVTITFTTTPETVAYPGGKTDTYRGGPGRDRILLQPTSDGWEIADWTVL